MSFHKVAAIPTCIVMTLALFGLPARDEGRNVADEQAFRNGCSLQTLQGGYANSFFFLNTTGSVPSTIADFTHTPGAGVALLDFDGRGHYTQRFTVSVGGLILRLQGSGTYTVNLDCTGTRILNIAGGPQGIPFDFVIADNGKEVRELSTQQGDVALGHWRKQ